MGRRRRGGDAAQNNTRPTTRSECPDTRPCPWGCVYNLAYDVTPGGRLKLPLGKNPAKWGENCALDWAEREQGMTLEAVGELMGLTRERVRQIQDEALGSLEAEMRWQLDMDEDDDVAGLWDVLERARPRSLEGAVRWAKREQASLSEDEDDDEEDAA